MKSAPGSRGKVGDLPWAENLEEDPPVQMKSLGPHKDADYFQFFQ